jgi:hypothetical protein
MLVSRAYKENVPRPLLFWREKKFKIWPEKKTRAKKVFWGPLKTKKANKPKKQTNQKRPKTKKWRKPFFYFFSAFYLIN